MRCVIPLMLAACALAGEGDRIVTVEAYGFGLSYHSNQDINWNQENYGLGIGLAAREADETVEAIAIVATYRDSFNEPAYLLQAGFRKTFGDYDGFHGTLGVTVGFLKGSGNNGASILPVASIGYDWIDLCLTGMPPMGSGAEQQGTDPQDNRMVDTAVIAAFVKIRLWEF
jgi:hypothetical protein